MLRNLLDMSIPVLWNNTELATDKRRADSGSRSKIRPGNHIVSLCS